jgi:glycosyltransferase involved in cell wall biosynthesis
LVNSRFSRESVRRAYGIEAKVCYLGIDTGLFANCSGERRPFVVSVGRLEPPKNPEFLIRAIALSQTKPHLCWIANGVDADCAQAVDRLAAQLGVSWELQIGITDPELIERYHDALVMLYAPRLEPFGLAPLEANSCGMPVIALAEGGIRESIVQGENGMLIDDESEMADALDSLMRHPEKARALGQRAAEHVRRNWSLEAATCRLETYLTDLVRAADATSSRRARSSWPTSTTDTPIDK